MTKKYLNNLPFSIFRTSVEESRKESEFVGRSFGFRFVETRILDDRPEHLVVFVVGFGPEIVKTEKNKKYIRLK